MFVSHKEVIKNEFTAVQCVKYYFPDMQEEEAHSMLWEKTCFPFQHENTLKELYSIYLNTEVVALK